MQDPSPPGTILLAEDNEGDFVLVKEAMEEAGIAHELIRVGNGEELMDYLARHAPAAGSRSSSDPALILLDLNMPRKDGRETIREIRRDARLSHIPIIALTTSNAREDVLSCYRLGANSYIMKPDDYGALVEMFKSISRYWLELVELPR